MLIREFKSMLSLAVGSILLHVWTRRVRELESRLVLAYPVDGSAQPS